MDRTSIRIPLLLGLAIWSIFPAEAIGIDGWALQKVSVFGAEIPYLELVLTAVVPMAIFEAVMLSYRGTLSSRAWVMFWLLAFPQCVLGFVYLVFRNTITFNQAFGHALLLSTPIVLSYCINQGERVNWSVLRVALDLQAVFVAIYCTSLIVHVWGLANYASDQIVLIDRFEGGDLRFRWAAFRTAEKMLISASAAWAIYRWMYSGSVLWLSIPIIGLVHQLIQSSRGGALLVGLAIAIASIVVRRENSPLFRRAVAIRVVFVLMLSVLIVVGPFTEKGAALIASMSEASDPDSIRARMRESAEMLINAAPFFGHGFFDLFSSAEWSPFRMDKMLLPIHNMFLHYWVYYGLVGVLLFGCTLFVIGFALLRSFLEFSKGKYDDRQIIVLGVSISVAISGLYTVYFQVMDRVSAIYLYAFMALVLNLPSGGRRATQRDYHSL